jgi:hypothetical protein
VTLSHHDGVNDRRAINGESLVDHRVCGRLFGVAALIVEHCSPFA